MLSKGHVRSKILVVDDEPEAVELVEFNLKQAGYDVVTAADGAEALKKARTVLPGLVLLDLMLPEIDGLEVCKMLRRDPATAGIPIIMVTAKAAEIDRILGLELGADDYITKPFSPRELVLRVKKMLQRGPTAGEEQDTFKFGELVIDSPRHLVSWRGKQIELTATEFSLLRFFLLNPRRVLSKGQILQNVWRYDFGGNSNVVETYVSYLRRKLDALGPPLIKTVRQAGYMLEAERE